MTTINFADEQHPRYAERHGSVVDGADLAKVITSKSVDDGISNIRSRRQSRATLARAYTIGSTDEDPGLLRDSDLRSAQKFDGKMLCLLAYQAIGVIYGDIGTSPLYVYSSTFTEPPTKRDLVGVLSLILWSLIMMVTVKYVLIVLYADNEGEGGTFSTYAMLSRYLNITNRDPREQSLVRMKRWATGDMNSSGEKMRKGLESSKFARTALKLMGIFSVTMVLADGVLTPAQSVLGAVQGIQVVDPTLSIGVIIGVTDAILVFLFLLQPLGISKITVFFSPIIIIWLGFNAVYGAYNLALYDATVFKAFNPGYAFQFLIEHKEDGWRRLGGVLLTFTGVEALFADLGAFSRQAIQLSWLCYVLPCLILAYTGQAAYISVHPEAYDNPFFKAAPPGTIYPSLIIAILAAIVASQAIITASFQLLAQIMKLSYFPQLKVVHTSKTFHGQLYVPLANWLLMVGTILIASIYNNTTRLGNAYGVCVMFVTFFDTTMVTLVATMVWRINPWYVALPWLAIACMDGTFLSSALTKVPDGAWFTLTLAGVIACIFLVWRYGKEQQWFAEAQDRFPTSHLVTTDAEHNLRLTDYFGGTDISQIRGFGMFFDKAGDKTPTVFSNFALKLTAAPQVMIFFHLRPLEAPSVPAEDRFTFSRLAIPNCYRCVVRYGFNDVVVTPDLASVVQEQLKHYLSNQQHVTIISPEMKAESNDAEIAEKIKSQSDRIASELATIDDAFNHKVLYVIGKQQMKIKSGTNYFRRVFLEMFLWMRENSRNKIANLNVPTDRVVEVGFLKEI